MADEPVRGSSSPGSPGIGGAISDAISAIRKTFVENPKKRMQQEKEDLENKYVDGDGTHDPNTHGSNP